LKIEEEKVDWNRSAAKLCGPSADQLYKQAAAAKKKGHADFGGALKEISRAAELVPAGNFSC